MSINTYHITLFRYIFLLFFLLALPSCTLRKLKKEAVQFHQAGMYEHATNNYLAVLAEKPADTDAKIGLMKSSALYAAELESNISKYYISANDDKVVENYNRLLSLVQQTKQYSVPLEMTDRTKGEYADAQVRYIENYYAQALQAINLKNYSTAQGLLQKVSDEDPDYKNTAKLVHFVTCEPIYQLAFSSLKSQSYQAAYRHAYQLANIDPNYKDVQYIKTEAYTAARQYVLFEYMGYDSSYPDFKAYLKELVFSSMKSSPNAFYTLVEESQYNNMLFQWKQSLHSGVDAPTEGIIPAKTIMKVKVNRITSRLSNLKKEKCKGFIRYEDKDGVVTYKKIYYNEYTRDKFVTAELYYSVGNRIKGNILESNTYSRTTTDKIHYIHYNGKDDLNIVPGYWKDQRTRYNPDVDKVYDTYINRSKMRSLSTARRTFESTATMERTLAKQLSDQLVRALRSAE